MFSGIVETVGRVRTVVEREATRRIRIDASGLADALAPGDSVSVDGACLTVTDRHVDGFSVDVIGTTLDRTIAGRYADGDAVNLERALVLGTRLDGHLVQGHVDGVGQLKHVVKDGEYWLMDFALPEEVHAQTIEHGSVTLNGVSLTVSELLSETGVRIGVIPFTRSNTNLGGLEVGDPINVEGDLIGKYVERILARRGGTEGGA